MLLRSKPDYACGNGHERKFIPEKNLGQYRKVKSANWIEDRGCPKRAAFLLRGTGFILA